MGKTSSQKSLVSIIMHFLDEEKYILEAIESIINQSYSNWELILIDDGSKDESTNIAIDYSRRYPEKISYFDHPGHENKGMSVSRNLALKKTKGEFIAFLDADDVWLCDKLDSQVQLLESNPDVAMVYGPALLWYSWSGNSVNSIKDYVQRLNVRGDSLVRPLTWVKNFLCDEAKGIPTTCGILVRKDIFESLEWFDESFRIQYTDMPFYARVFSEKIVFASSKCLCKYRQHKESCCSIAAKSGSALVERKRFLLWLKDYLHRKRINNPFILVCLNTKLWLCSHNSINNIALLLVRVNRLILSNIFPKLLRIIRVPFTLPLRLFRFFISRLRMSFCLKPLSEKWGFGRGFPLHRYYIEKFLLEFSGDIHGDCMEFQDNYYTLRFGGESVQKIDVLHLNNCNPMATIIADLTKPNHIPDECFDCIICTHVLHVVLEYEKAISELRRILRPGGIILFAVPLISMYEPNSGELWRFTPELFRISLTRVFGDDNVLVKSYGNSLIAAGEIRGLVVSEFTKAELDYYDHRFAIEVCARVIKR